MVNIKNIIKIGAERIKYRDEKGEEKYIELASSANTWAYRHPDAQRADGKPRCVADRFCDGKTAYYEFYNIGHTRLGISVSPIKKLFGGSISPKEHELFMSLQKKLEEHGWTTFDLT